MVPTQSNIYSQQIIDGHQWAFDLSSEEWRDQGPVSKTPTVLTEIQQQEAAEIERKAAKARRATLERAKAKAAPLSSLPRRKQLQLLRSEANRIASWRIPVAATNRASNPTADQNLATVRTNMSVLPEALVACQRNMRALEFCMKRGISITKAQKFLHATVAQFTTLYYAASAACSGVGSVRSYYPYKDQPKTSALSTNNLMTQEKLGYNIFNDMLCLLNTHKDDFMLQPFDPNTGLGFVRIPTHGMILDSDKSVPPDKSYTIDFGRYYMYAVYAPGGTIVRAGPRTADDELIYERRYPHPHIKAYDANYRWGEVCTGDGRDAIARALSVGNIVDAFLILESVLNYYNAGSPYAPLNHFIEIAIAKNRYKGPPLPPPPQPVVCPSCENTVFSNLLRSSPCQCGSQVCSSCALRCGGRHLEERPTHILCKRCGKRCNRCSVWFCADPTHKITTCPIDDCPHLLCGYVRCKAKLSCCDRNICSNHIFSCPQCGLRGCYDHVYSTDEAHALGMCNNCAQIDRCSCCMIPYASGAGAELRVKKNCICGRGICATCAASCECRLCVAAGATPKLFCSDCGSYCGICGSRVCNESFIVDLSRCQACNEAVLADEAAAAVASEQESLMVTDPIGISEADHDDNTDDEENDDDDEDDDDSDQDDDNDNNEENTTELPWRWSDRSPISTQGAIANGPEQATAETNDAPGAIARPNAGETAPQGAQGMAGQDLNESLEDRPERTNFFYFSAIDNVDNSLSSRLARWRQHWNIGQ